MRRRAVAALLLFASVAVPSAALAETVTLTAELSGKSEVPPHDGTATGKAEMTLDTDSRTFTWNVQYSGLSGPAIGAHIHGPVHPGNNAGIMIPFPTTETPITGSMTITEAQARDILAGLTYVNIHTKAHPGGEIRGQLTK
jgi:hypothetical protein